MTNCERFAGNGWYCNDCGFQADMHKSQPLYELTVYVSVHPDKADYLLEKLCNTVEDYGYGWERASAQEEGKQVKWSWDK